MDGEISFQNNNINSGNIQSENTKPRVHYPPQSRRTPMRSNNPNPGMQAPPFMGSLVLIGVIIFFIGSITVQTVPLIDSDDFDSYDEFRDSMNLRNAIGRILNWIGCMIIATPLYYLGVNGNLDWKVRASMLSTATALVISTMIVTLFFSFSM